MFPVSTATPVFFAVVCLMTAGYWRHAIVATAMTKPYNYAGLLQASRRNSWEGY